MGSGKTSQKPLKGHICYTGSVKGHRRRDDYVRLSKGPDGVI